ncbi:MAG: AmmeMemoRadiSam system radical SAM enzyme [Anaerolineaceae bacterium]
MHKANFWTQAVIENAVDCHLCHQFCTIREGRKGICGVRKNLDGQLYSLNYGKLIAAHIDPIEKKPLFHFLPGSYSYSIAAPGCNFRCSWCQNWEISQASTRNNPESLAYTAPEKVVEAAREGGCQSISYTYTEPTIFYEYARDVSRLAREVGLKNVWVSNGYMSDAMLDECLPMLDAINVDLKAFDETIHRKFTGAHLQPILDNCRKLKKVGVWLEVTTLLIPGINDDEAQIKGLADFIANDLGKDTPWHVSRYYPQPQFREIQATDPGKVAQALKIGKDAGLQYVYGGNLGTREDSYCPVCGELMIVRSSSYILENKLDHGNCPECGSRIAGIWE